MQTSTQNLTTLRGVLEHCARRVPLYRGIEPPRENESATAALARFPVLTKERLRRSFAQLVPEGRTLAGALGDGEIQVVGTSGTSGERVQVLWHQPWWDAQELEGFQLHSAMAPHVLRPNYREAVLTTPVCSGNLCHVRALPMEERIDNERTLFLNQTVDPSLWSDADVARMADELERFEPDALEADPAYLAHFAVRLAKLQRRPYQPRFIDVSYEFPARSHVAAIERAFECPVIDTYGSTECGFVLCACERGRYHHNAPWSHVELSNVARMPGVASLIVTPLGNPWLNLVRFDSGDLVRAAHGSCACGRAHGAVESIEGRITDLVFSARDEFVTVRSVDLALGNAPGLLHWRLVQRSARDFELECVPDELRPLAIERGVEALRELLGVAPVVRTVRSIPVEASGKFRLCRALHVDAAALARSAP